jgi:hypothetical protein
MFFPSSNAADEPHPDVSGSLGPEDTSLFEILRGVQNID